MNGLFSESLLSYIMCNLITGFCNAVYCPPTRECDAQMEVDIRNYDMHEVLMAPEGKFLFLKVPGLSENR